ncbi:MAG: B12-binding domain-containing radical SAM protein [Candidatus Njordarchaeales archaeon]
MRILLINPPTIHALKKIAGVTGPPLGLAYLAAVARENGFTVKIIDAVAENLSLKELSREIKFFDPDVVGVTATTPMIPDAYAVAHITKMINPNALVIIGGPHVTFLPERTLRECPYIDIVVRGEGEKTFEELLNTIDSEKRLQDVRGITYLDKEGRIRSTPPRPLIRNIDDIPIPAYDLLPLDKYQIDGINFATIITSRGCPYNCIFCSSSALFGHVYRAHSVDRVLEEVSLLRYKFNIREIEFLDDTFTLNKKRAKEISKEIVRNDMDVSWSASSRVNTIDYETALYMRRAGAHTVYLGIESGTQKILNFIRKKITLNQARDAVKVSKKAGLGVLGSFVIGFPIETLQDINTTISFSKSLDLEAAQYTVATPYPGTDLWTYSIRHKLLLTEDWRKYTALDVVMKSFFLSPKQIKRLLFKAYVSFYLRLKYIVEDIVKRGGLITLKAIVGTIKSIIEKLWLTKS